MPSFEALEASINSEKENIKEIGSRVADLEKSSDEPEARRKTCAEMSHEITKKMITLDSIDISRDSAVAELKKGNTDASKKMAVLLTRRKTCIKSLESLAGRVEAVNDSLK
mmetsp:Transcript_18520/g.49036  ORF Transcript_18520/g.49036 Transcript_18520/m.49036 type:complete len:111 (-) Transcript_18520:83-415(-)